MGRYEWFVGRSGGQERKLGVAAKHEPILSSGTSIGRNTLVPLAAVGQPVAGSTAAADNRYGPAAVLLAMLPVAVLPAAELAAVLEAEPASLLSTALQAAG